MPQSGFCPRTRPGHKNAKTRGGQKVAFFQAFPAGRMSALRTTHWTGRGTRLARIARRLPQAQWRAELARIAAIRAPNGKIPKCAQ